MEAAIALRLPFGLHKAERLMAIAATPRPFESPLLSRQGKRPSPGERSATNRVDLD